MRNAILISMMTVALVASAVTVQAGPPAAGTYKSSAPWSQFDEGREASSWPGANTFLSTGNVLHAESWDGVGFGTDWKILCPTVTNVTEILDLTVGGTGQKIYLIEYAGGYVHLGGTGPWAGGDANYVGLIQSYFETRTIQYVAGNMVGSVSDHSVAAQIQGYSQSCVAWGIGNGVWLGNSPTAKPAGYPSWNDLNCNANQNDGHWGDIRDLTVSVTGCAVSTQQKSWGAVKSLYRN